MEPRLCRGWWRPGSKRGVWLPWALMCSSAMLWSRSPWLLLPLLSKAGLVCRSQNQPLQQVFLWSSHFTFLSVVWGSTARELNQEACVKKNLIIIFRGMLCCIIQQDATVPEGQNNRLPKRPVDCWLLVTVSRGGVRWEGDGVPFALPVRPWASAWQVPYYKGLRPTWITKM